MVGFPMTPVNWLFIKKAQRAVEKGQKSRELHYPSSFCSRLAAQYFFILADTSSSFRVTHGFATAVFCRRVNAHTTLLQLLQLRDRTLKNSPTDLQFVKDFIEIQWHVAQ